MKSCGCFLFGGEYEARTRDLLHAMQVYNFKVKSPKNLPYSAFTIKSTFYARLILHTFTHISVKICSFVCPLFVQNSKCMPTFSIEIREKNERRDGKFPVSIRLTHKREVRKISTGVYVSRKQVKPDFSGIKDTTILKGLLNDISKYEDMLAKGLGTDLSRFSAADLVKYIESQKATEGGVGIDFIAFCDNHIQALKAEGRDGTAGRFEAVIRNLTDYFGRSIVFVKEINVKNLQGFVEYMQKPHEQTRTNQHGKEVTVRRPGCKAQTVKDYLADIHTLFNAACDHYNDEDAETVLITHRPFGSKKLQVEVKEEPEKRDLCIEDLVKILNAETVPGKRMQLARDVLALSFYLLAMNTADLFGADVELEDDRIIYHRQKTANRRKDEALMSVKIEPEALSLIEKYRDPDKRRLFSFYKMYANFRDFNHNVNAGCKQLAAHLGIDVPLSTYYMRHTRATLASEECGISETDIALALNHVGVASGFESGKSLKTTRGYIHRRFTRNDTNNRIVLDYVKSKY